ncbi:MAG: phosphatase PAP2 family protein [Bacteroidia bacterium]|nr:phosphatase PAP2 family protein [Bacteroidia bacterium]
MKKIVFIFLLFFTKLFSQNIDVDILKTINRNDMPCWDKTMKGFSFSAYPVGMVSPLGVLAHGYIKKDKVLIRNGYKSCITLGVAMSISTALKYSIQRERPFKKYPLDIIRRDEVGTASFPSGHTTSAFASATVLSLSYKKWYVTIPAYAYAGLMGYSRMRLGVHYPSDVLGGMVLGIGTGLLTWQIDKMIQRKKNKEVTNSSVAE